MEITPYTRLTHYYETDQMGIIHNSNYLRFFEEARVDMLRQLGFPYVKMEELGVMLPVLSSYCEYKIPIKWDERIQIVLELHDYNGLRMTVVYRIFRPESGELCATGETKHCFVDAQSFRPMRMQKAHPEIHAVFAAQNRA